jgi:two-component system, cell cycle sensor histidine kinase and response regulator CckA
MTLRRIQELWTTATMDRLFNSSGIGFVIVAPNRCFLDANNTFCEKLGYTKDELLRMTITDLTHPDDLGFTQKVFTRGVATGATQVFDKRYVTKDGRTLWVRLRSAAVNDAEGKVMYRIVMVEDITEHKANELFLEQMVAIVETSEDAIFRADTQGIIQFWSKGAERLYGYKAEEVIGRQADFIAANTKDPKVADAPGRLMRGEVVVDPSGQALHKNGSVLHVSVLLFPLKNKEGEIIAFATVHRHIGELKRLEEKLRHSQRMETAGLLAGGVAHDFNNILTVIQGAASALVQEIPPGAKSRRHVELIARSADKANRLTRQLLAFSRKQKIAPQVLDPNELLREFSSMLQRTLGNLITLETQYESHWSVKEDPTQLEQIVLNLCVNARHAMPQGGKLRIETRDISFRSGEPLVFDDSPGTVRHAAVPLQPGEYVLIAITDTGVGIDRQDIGRIFEPFYTTRSRGEGTGLGLAVVSGIVLESGGGLEVSSKAHHGSCFRIFLRRSEGVVKRELPRGEEPGQQGKGRVLIIEDDDDVRSLIVEMLDGAGYTVCEASSPKQLVEEGLPMPVDLILSDIVMPDMNGPDFAKYWQARFPEVKFLFMSGYFDEKKYPEQFAQGNLLLKPFKPSELLARVAREIEKSCP